MSSRHLFIAALIPASLSLAACAGPLPGDEQVESAQARIEGGAVASAYPEAVIIDGVGQPCSGALLAPGVVITSARCAPAGGRVHVTAPFADDQASDGSGSTADDGDGLQHDVGLVYLDASIDLAAYPQLASSPSRTARRS